MYDAEQRMKEIMEAPQLSAVEKIGTLGVHVSAQKNSMVAMKKISFTIISKHLYFEVTIQPAAGYLVDCWLYSD